jgi:hypothetical protein
MLPDGEPESQYAAGPVYIPAWEPCCGEPCGVRNRSYVRVGLVPGMDCARPVQLVRGCGAIRVTKCDSRRDDKCGPCSARNQRYLIRRAEHGGQLPGEHALLTVTCTGENDHDRLDPKLDGHFAHAGHHLALPSWRKKNERRPACSCHLHKKGDRAGQPITLEEWNPSAGACWNRMLTALRRRYPDVQFFKVVEVQKRGALHLHIMCRTPAGAVLDVLELQGLALAAGFGCSVSLDRIPAARAARYVAKYAGKAYKERADVPWKDYVLDKGTGEMRPRQTAAYRAVSQSRRWGLTLRQIKGEIRASRARAAALDPPAVAWAGAGPVGVEAATVGTLVAHSPP